MKKLKRQERLWYFIFFSMLRSAPALRNRPVAILTKNVVYRYPVYTYWSYAHSYSRMLLYWASDVGPLYATAVDVSFLLYFPFRFEVHGQLYLVNVTPPLLMQHKSRVGHNLIKLFFASDFTTVRQVEIPALLRIHDILGCFRIRIRGSMPLTNGSGSGSWIRILLFSSLTFKIPAQKKIFDTIFSAYYFLKVHLRHFSKINSQKESQNSRNQGSSYFFCMMIEGSGSGSIPLTNGSGSGRPKKTCGSGSATLISRYKKTECVKILAF
jgi:hypothetical protein